jgi:hypothetical protein
MAGQKFTAFEYFEYRNFCRLYKKFRDSKIKIFCDALPPILKEDEMGRSENLKERDHSEDLDVDGKIILEWIYGKWCGKV